MLPELFVYGRPVQIRHDDKGRIRWRLKGDLAYSSTDSLWTLFVARADILFPINETEDAAHVWATAVIASKIVRQDTFLESLELYLRGN